MDGLLVLLLLVAAVVVVSLWTRSSRLSQEVTKTHAEINRLSGRVQLEARTQFLKWRQEEIDAVKRDQLEIAEREAQVKLDEWKVSSEADIRKDARQRSQSVIVGKVTEHIIPYLPDFSYNPKDARFVGSPVDFIVFDGLDAGSVRQVVFVEVKTGGSSLTPRERQVRDAVREQRAAWKELRIASPAADVAVDNAIRIAPTEPSEVISEETAIVQCPDCGFPMKVKAQGIGERGTIRC